MYLRTLLIHGTRAVLANVAEKSDRLSAWARALIERRGYRRAAVALAAKNARIAWALMHHGTTYQRQAALRNRLLTASLQRQSMAQGYDPMNEPV